MPQVWHYIMCCCHASLQDVLVSKRWTAAKLGQLTLSPTCLWHDVQLYDIEIDRVNKPYLPLAAGDFSVPTGWALVVATGAASLAIGAGGVGWLMLGAVA